MNTLRSEACCLLYSTDKLMKGGEVQLLEVREVGEHAGYSSLIDLL